VLDRLDPGQRVPVRVGVVPFGIKQGAVTCKGDRAGPGDA
jgi:hypothetical protein